MRVIDQKTVDAVNSGRNWNSGNTSVRHTNDGCHVYLHNNLIATIAENGEVIVNIQVLKNWPTLTTKSHLRALGVDISTVKGVTMLNGVDINTL